MTLYLDDGDVRLYLGDSSAVLATLPEASVDCVVTSPPYFGLRDYGYDEQIGLEDTPAAFVARLVEVFREVRRVLAPHGVCWVNMGDSYAAGGMSNPSATSTLGGGKDRGAADYAISRRAPSGSKPKDLLGIPWRLAFALQDDGWWLRSDVIWAKPNPMPESVTDRPTKAHEYLFLLTKAPRYYWDAEGVREPPSDNPGGAAFYARKGLPMPSRADERKGRAGRGDGPETSGFSSKVPDYSAGRNVRTVWTFATEPNPVAHFATFPRELVRRCLAAGCPEQVCAECGAPRTRIVKRTSMVVRPSPKRDAAQAGEDAGHHRTAVGGTVVAPPTSATVGWSDCGHGAYRPGVVLDPFIGSGTTAAVARATGRHAIGVDGNPAYLEIAARRLSQLSLLGGLS